MIREMTAAEEWRQEAWGDQRAAKLDAAQDAPLPAWLDYDLDELDEGEGDHA